MFSNYFKLAWRAILRNRASSVINITGLTVGISCVLLIAMYVQDELSFDRFFSDSNRIYQVNLESNLGGQDFYSGTTPPPVGQAIATTFPEVESFTRVYHPSDEVVRTANGGSATGYFTERDIIAADSNFFQVFDFPMLEGDAATCLADKNSVVIAEETAKKYFGKSSAVGKTLLFGNGRKPAVVTGVLESLPSTSTLRFDIVKPMAAYPVVKQFSWSWVWLQMNTYVKLRDNVDNSPAALRALEAKLPAMVRVQGAAGFKRIGRPIDSFLNTGGKWNLHLQPLTDVHLHSAGINTNLDTLSDVSYVYIFSTVALFIMILACVNFMNLSTAQSAKRAKEVGIRKVLGSQKKELIKQFLAEAILCSCIAALLAFAITAAVLTPFNHVAEKSIPLTALFSVRTVGWVLGLVLLVGLLAGSYPAFYLTSFKPVNVLKCGLFKSPGSNRAIRNGLVVFQFSISTALIVCTLVVSTQLRYTRDKDLGLSRENVVVISNTNSLDNSERVFRDEVAAMPEVAHASIVESLPTKYLFGDSYAPQPNGQEQGIAEEVSLTSFIVDNDFIPAMEMQLLEGRAFSKDFNDSLSVIVNEACVKEVGWKNPVGQSLKYPGGNDQMFKVVGVVKDFNYQSLRSSVTPFALFHTSSKTYDIGTSYVIAKIKSGDTRKALDGLAAKWKKFTSDTPFEYSFLDEEFDALYRADQRMGTVFNLFTVLALVVACLGLLGLTAYTAERRTKEIGIRKVLGASVPHVVGLLSKDMMKLVVIAAIIAFPVAWWYMNRWLEGFAYRIHISWWIFLTAGVAAVVIAQLTISFQAIKAAIVNPAKSLRTE